MLTAEEINEKWAKMIMAEDVPEINDNYRKVVTAKLLENQESVTRQERGDLSESTNIAPAGVGAANTGAIQTWDPVLISMVRRAAPVSIGFDIWGVQPMNAPTGLIFAMKSKYADNADLTAATEAGFAEADSTWSGGEEGAGGTAIGGTVPDAGVTDPFDANYGTGVGMLTAAGELLGTTGHAFNEMGFEIVKKSVEAKTRALKATWSVELQQDLMAVHGMSAENELANILSSEVTAEIDREMIRRAYIMAKAGCAQADLAVAGTFDLDTDSNGRWSVERFKGLMYQIEREANAIALLTRRGKANFMITSADVASALAMTGLLEANPTTVSPGSVNPASSSYVGVMNGTMKVFIDPFVTTNGVLVGYKGTNPYDAAGFYCPYVPYTVYRSQGEDDFQPRMGIKTRYGFTINPYDNDGVDELWAGDSSYMRKFKVANLV